MMMMMTMLNATGNDNDDNADDAMTMFFSVRMAMHRQAYSARSRKQLERRQRAMACSAAVLDRDGMLCSSAASLSLLTAKSRARVLAL